MNKTGLQASVRYFAQTCQTRPMYFTLYVRINGTNNGSYIHIDISQWLYNSVFMFSLPYNYSVDEQVIHDNLTAFFFFVCHSSPSLLQTFNLPRRASLSFDISYIWLHVIPYNIQLYLQFSSLYACWCPSTSFIPCRFKRMEFLVELLFLLNAYASNAGE